MPSPPPWLALLITLWANLHSSYMLGLVLAALLAGEAVVLAPDWGARLRAARGWAVFGGLSVAAALLTPFGDLWLNALGDAGTSLPHKPLDERANLCELRVAALPGWALGAAATVQQSGWRMPPDPLSSDPLQSQVRTTVELYVVGAAIEGGRKGVANIEIAHRASVTTSRVAS